MIFSGFFQISVPIVTVVGLLFISTARHKSSCRFIFIDTCINLSIYVFILRSLKGIYSLWGEAETHILILI